MQTQTFDQLIQSFIFRIQPQNLIILNDKDLNLNTLYQTYHEKKIIIHIYHRR
jgi:hypothetical protein